MRTVPMKTLDQAQTAIRLIAPLLSEAGVIGVGMCHDQSWRSKPLLVIATVHPLPVVVAPHTLMPRVRIEALLQGALGMVIEYDTTTDPSQGTTVDWWWRSA